MIRCLDEIVKPPDHMPTTPDSGAPDPGPDPAFEAAKRASFGQVLLRAARLFNDEAVAKLQRTQPLARTAHTQLLPHLSRVGIRPTDLARRVGISKQAVGELLEDMVRFGAVERVADPTDRRARLVRLTDVGQTQLWAGLGVLGELARELEAAMGSEAFSRLQTDLLSLHDTLVDRSARRPGAHDRVDAR
jgi:DNA-binding MarR family transcriptional regulator